MMKIRNDRNNNDDNHNDINHNNEKLRIIMRYRMIMIKTRKMKLN